MEIKTVDHGNNLTSRSRLFAKRRLLFALSRFNAKIDAVTLTVRDINGPRGGIDKECQIRVQLHRGEDIIIIDRDSQIEPCISRASDRVSRTVARQLGRIRDSMRRRNVGAGGLS